MEPYTLITGASSGIGRAVARRLAVNSPVILAGRNVARLEETAGICNGNKRPILWSCDFENTEEVFDSLRELLEAHEVVVNCFIHCAGTFTVSPMRLTTHDITHRTMSVNFYSASEIIRSLLKKKINRSSLKNITIISSIASLKGSPGYAAYAASKGAIDSYVRSLAVELAPLIRVNAVVPGAIRTPGTEHLFAMHETSSELDKLYPLGPGNINDIVNTIEFVASEKARWITGQQIVIDGGRTII